MFDKSSSLGEAYRQYSKNIADVEAIYKRSKHIYDYIKSGCTICHFKSKGTIDMLILGERNKLM